MYNFPNHVRGRSNRNLHAFTLIELLVVVAIIALLIAVLLPALRQAKAVAKTVACLSNQRQIGVAMQMWLNDKNGWFPHKYIGIQGGGRFPPPDNSSNGAFPLDWYVYGQYLGWDDLLVGTKEFQQTAKAAYCPADNDGMYPRNGSYEVNAFMGGNVKCFASDIQSVYPNFYPKGKLAIPDQKGTATQRRLVELRTPSTAPVLADGAGMTFGWRGDWAYNDNFIRWRFFHGPDYSQTQVVGNTILNKKGDAINFLFADGRAQTAALAINPVPNGAHDFTELFGGELRPNNPSELFR